MGIWHEIPFLRILFPFLAGTFLGLAGFGGTGPAWMLFLLVPVQFLFMRTGRSWLPYTYRWIPGIFIQLFFIAAGMMAGDQADARHHRDYYGHLPEAGQKRCWIVCLDQEPVVRSRRIRAQARVLAQADSSSLKKVRGKIMLYLDRKDSLLRLQPGDILMIRCRLTPPPGAENPGAFDYSAFLARKGIRHLATADTLSRKLVSRNPGPGLSSRARRWQRQLAGTLKAQGLGTDETSVATAMLLGDMEGFGQDLRGAYARAGVTHILCVSGLHVGLVFLIFSRILFFLDGNRRLRLIKACTLILLTWAYALLTGLSPSVQRAACMCSFMILGKTLGRRNDVINSLLASAFLLLWTDPFILFNYGFQLSYLAVGGIVLLEPLIFPWVCLTNPLLDKGWKLTAVSLAAQLATGPVAVYHFHQFPTWFIPANLMTIPLSGIIMYAGILFLVCSPVPLLSWTAAKVLGLSIGLMNHCIRLVDALPLSVIEGLYPSGLSTALSYLCLVFLAAWISTSRNKYFFSLLLAGLFLVVSLQLKGDFGIFA